MTERLSLWFSICDAFGFPGTSFSMLKDIMDMYSDKQRYYHVWKHVDRCLDELDQFVCAPIGNYMPASLSSKETLLVSYALIMHDAVYDTRSTRNEENSALLARAIAGSDVADELILGTKLHKLSENSLVNVTNDIDMSILGYPWEDYNIYSGGVRNEHCFTSDEGWKHGRSMWIMSTLNGRIFHTNYFFDKFEDQARKNLKRELAEMGVEYEEPKEPGFFY